MLTPQEVSQYARLTLKEYGLTDHSVLFVESFDHPEAIGQANPWKKRVELSERCLGNFRVFKYTLLHEIAHLIQFKRMGNTFVVNKNRSFHGKVFRQVCREMGISPSEITCFR